MKPGEVRTFSLQLKNTGTWSWKAGSKLYIKVPYSGSSLFHYTSWLTQDTLIKLPSGIKPGAKTTVKFTLAAPITPENYTLKFYIAGAAKVAYPGTAFSVPLTVASTSPKSITIVSTTCRDAAVCVSLPSSTVAIAKTTTTPCSNQDAQQCVSTPSTTDESAIQTRVLIPEPNIRVALFSSSSPVTFVSPFLYEAFAGNESKGFINENSEVELAYNNGTFLLSSTDTTFSSSEPIRLVPRADDAYFIIPNYYHHLAGRTPASFNAFRGTLEYRYGTASKIPFVVNELLLDQYTAGVAETSNDAAPEYMKALMIAARTYGFVRSGPVSKTHTYDVEPTSADQIYLGYYSEIGMPNVARAVSDTAGIMVTYNGKPVLTNYFGHSDGKTRDGAINKPWLKSVPAIYDKGLELWGHGVGMSGHDASMHALKDGWTYEQILKYYYTGVEVEKVY